MLIITFDQHKIDTANDLIQNAILITHNRDFILSRLQLLRQRIHSLLTAIFIKAKAKSLKASNSVIINSELTSLISEPVIEGSDIVAVWSRAC